MLNDSTLTRYGRHIYLLKRIRAVGIIFLSTMIVVGSIFVFLQIRNNMTNDRHDLLRVWNEGDFEQAYNFSKNALLESPLDYFLLTIHGFSAFQLGISQINNQNMLNFINECIFTLRKAKLQKEAAKDGRVFYVLGKAYSYKGSEYADLAALYLETAASLFYPAHDIPEYLGLAYAAYGDYRSSVAAFSAAFNPQTSPSDNLLMSIARSYMAMGEYNIAFGYLQRCVDTSPDSRSKVTARFLLAEIYISMGDYENARLQYISIINESGENAEARFQLGELFYMQGETTRARSEWRTAYRLDPAHARARARLN